jgi:hypothetical protein
MQVAFYIITNVIIQVLSHWINLRLSFLFCLFLRSVNEGYQLWTYGCFKWQVLVILFLLLRDFSLALKVSLSEVSFSRDFLHLLQTGFSPSLVLLHPHSRFVVVCPFSGALLDSIPMPGVVIGVLPFDEHFRTISVVFSAIRFLLFVSTSTSFLITSFRTLS